MKRSGTHRNHKIVKTKIFDEGSPVSRALQSLTGQFADIDPPGGLFQFTSESLEQKIILCVYNSKLTRYYLITDWGILSRPKGKFQTVIDKGNILLLKKRKL